MTTKKQIHGPLASLNLPRLVPALILLAKQLVQSMTGNAPSLAPTPSLANVTAAINALEVAQSAAQARAHGAATLRDEKCTTLVSMLEQLKTYVQTTAAGRSIMTAGLKLKTRVLIPHLAHAMPHDPDESLDTA